jgi:hypothetical protein
MPFTELKTSEGRGKLILYAVGLATLFGVFTPEGAADLQARLNELTIVALAVVESVYGVYRSFVKARQAAPPSA